MRSGVFFYDDFDVHLETGRIFMKRSMCEKVNRFDEAAGFRAA